MIIIEPNQLEKAEAYFLSISGIVPRPIALITTLNQDNTINAAPYSYFTGLSSQPAFVAFSIAQGRNGDKDTLKNILRSKEFAVHIPIKGMENDINICGLNFNYGDSELNYTNFTYSDCQKINGKRIKEIPFAMECNYVRHIDNLANFTLIIAEVLCYSIDKNFYNPQTKLFDYKNSIPLGRMGGMDYLYADNLVEVSKLKVKDFKK